LILFFIENNSENFSFERWVDCNSSLGELIIFSQETSRIPFVVGLPFFPLLNLKFDSSYSLSAVEALSPLDGKTFNIVRRIPWKIDLPPIIWVLS
jgi:hypothetical protein